LESILSRLQRYKNADGYEVKAFVISTKIDPLSPLIIGETFTAIAEDDKRLFRAGGGVVMHGRAATSMFASYFDELWEQSEYFIRPASGLDDRQVRALRAELTP
jgi:hypothetical protein